MKSSAANAAPSVSAAVKIGASDKRMSVKLLMRERARVTAGLMRALAYRREKKF